ncbi:MAG: hypothetical protein HRU34_06775 [Richelia sp.]|nr:hypothetical protein [Richelia sp.]
MQRLSSLLTNLRNVGWNGYKSIYRTIFLNSDRSLHATIPKTTKAARIN